MAKKLLKSLTMGLVVFATALLVGYLAYVATYHYQTGELKDSIDMALATPASQGAVPTEEVIRVDYYLARLENHKIAIYTVAEEEERFLYTLDVYTGNFPAAELLRLQEGVVLQNRQDLASFEEDYTS